MISSVSGSDGKDQSVGLIDFRSKSKSHNKKWFKNQNQNRNPNSDFKSKTYFCQENQNQDHNFWQIVTVFPDLCVNSTSPTCFPVLKYYYSNRPAATAADNSILYNFDSKIRIYFTKFLKVISSD